MGLLLQTDIDKKVEKYIGGKVGRVGGKVNQLIDYRHCQVEDINLIDGGYGEILKVKSSKRFSEIIALSKKYMLQELIYWRRGKMIPRDRKTAIFDMHDVDAVSKHINRFDSTISSNMLEHSPNVIQLLLHFYLITRKGGYQFHALPHKDYTFDMYRKPTEQEHFYEDFRNGVDHNDETHREEYRQSAVEKHGGQKKFHEAFPIAYPYMHFHVFNECNTKALFESIVTEVYIDVLKTEVFSDVVVMFKNELNPNFIKENRAYLKRYFVSDILERKK